MNYLAPAKFEAKFTQFRASVFRLETLRVYRGSGEDEALAAFEAGALVPPPDPEQDAWEAMIRGNVAAGRVMCRVHVVVEPLTEYMLFELTWAYAPNVAAGEDIRVIPVAGEHWPAGVPRRDFWLFDDAELFDAHYGPDGTWLGVTAVDDPGRIVEARRQRDAALDASMPWVQYVADRPELLARLPPVGGIARSR